MQRGILLTLLTVLVVRADRLLKYLLDNPGFLLSSEQCLPQLYRDLVFGKSVYLGLRDTSKQTRANATSEQKLWSVGDIIDAILVPCWENPAKLDRILECAAIENLAEALDDIPRFGGDLIFSHSLEYLYLIRTEMIDSNKEDILRFDLDDDALDTMIRLGN